MKQQKLEGYTPRFPRKTLKGAVLAAATAVALGTTGCITAGVPLLSEPTPEPVELDGAIAIEEPTDLPAIEGIVVPEVTPEPEEEELLLSGDVLVLPEEP